MLVFDKHMAAINSGVVTKTNVIGIRKLLSAADRRRRGLSLSVTCPNFHDGDDRALQNALKDKLPKVNDDLHESGKKLLQSKRYAKRWSPGQAAVIADLAEFRLVRFDWAGQFETPTPVYEVRAHSGGAFRFINVPWQNGGDGPEVTT